MKCCPTCGQTLPPDAELDGVHLSPKQKRIYELVRRAGKHGVVSDHLFNVVYQDDPDGGPTVGKHAIYQHVCNANIRLKAIGKKIAADGKGGRTGYPHYYRVVDL